VSEPLMNSRERCYDMVIGGLINWRKMALLSTAGALLVPAAVAQEKAIY
jgi:hypothetical protein